MTAAKIAIVSFLCALGSLLAAIWTVDWRWLATSLVFFWISSSAIDAQKEISSASHASGGEGVE